MKKAMCVCALAALLWVLPAHAQTGAPEGLPDDVMVLAELANVKTLDPKLADIAMAVDPGATPAPLVDALPAQTLKTQDPTTVDLSRPLHVVGLKPPLLESLALVFTVTDPQLYLDSISDDYEDEPQEDGVHVFTQAFLGFEEEGEDWGAEWTDSFAIGLSGNRAVLADDPAAVRAVLAMIQAGSLPEGPLFGDSDAGAVVRLKALLDALNAQGANPFDMMRGMMAMGMGMQPQAGIDPQKMLQVMVDGVEDLALQLDTVSAGVTLQADAVTGWSRVKAVEGSGMAVYINGMRGGELEMVRHMPADVVGLYAGRTGDLTPLVEWYGKFLGAVASPESAGALDAMKQLMADGVAQMGDEMAFAGGVGPEGHLFFVSAMRVKDPEQMKQFLASATEKFQVAGDFQQAFGVTTRMNYKPAALTHAGHEIAEWDIDYEFGAPAGMQGPQMDAMRQQMAVMQQHMVTVFWGEDLKAYGTFLDDVYVYAQGAGALDRLKAVIDSAASPAAGLPGLSEVLGARTGAPAAVGFLSLEKLVGFYMRAFTEAMTAMGGGFPMPPGLANMQIESGPPLAMAVWITGDGTLEKHFRLPVSALTNITGAFQQAMMGGMGQEPFMQP
ncbi:MAG: hypothetical protein AMK73_06255 [Planctomycetes bacterium SM23_32]|nr:MAG: hypothetical protein AMK73_06255 [Planctomycetes bacterium SM23_32]